MIIRILRGFAILWSSVVGLFWFTNAAYMWYYEGLSRVLELLSPFNIIYYFFVILTLSPAIGTFMLAERLERRKFQQDSNETTP